MSQTYYIYGEKHYGCGCCPSEYHFDYFDDKEEAMKCAAWTKLDGMNVTIIQGEEIELDEETYAKILQEKSEMERKEREEREALRKEEKRRRFEQLKKELGEE